MQLLVVITKLKECGQQTVSIEYELIQRNQQKDTIYILNMFIVDIVF